MNWAGSGGHVKPPEYPEQYNFNYPSQVCSSNYHLYCSGIWGFLMRLQSETDFEVMTHEANLSPKMD